jgi:hypothetical protein
LKGAIIWMLPKVVSDQLHFEEEQLKASYTGGE